MLLISALLPAPFVPPFPPPFLALGFFLAAYLSKLSLTNFYAFSLKSFIVNLRVSSSSLFLSSSSSKSKRSGASKLILSS